MSFPRGQSSELTEMDGLGVYSVDVVDVKIAMLQVNKFVSRGDAEDLLSQKRACIDCSFEVDAPFLPPSTAVHGKVQIKDEHRVGLCADVLEVVSNDGTICIADISYDGKHARLDGAHDQGHYIASLPIFIRVCVAPIPPKYIALNARDGTCTLRVPRALLEKSCVMMSELAGTVHPGGGRTLPDVQAS
jgi:hypothetical protein